MTATDDGKGFLGRWSERKRRARLEDAPKPDPAALEPVEEVPLPPLASLGADSDYTAFLRAGVTHELRALGLRRAWVTDPEIATFRGMAEYDWDFNVPGYGWLRPSDDVAALARRVFGDPPPEATPLAAEETPPEPSLLAEDAASVELVPVDPPPDNETQVESVAVAAPDPPSAMTPAWRHGGALPR